MVDTDFAAKKRFNMTELSKTAASFQIPQRRGGYQEFFFTPPPKSMISKVLIDGIIEPGNETYDKNVITGKNLIKVYSDKDNPIELKVYLHPGNKYRSFNFILNGINSIKTVKAFLSSNGIFEELNHSSIIMHNNSLAVIIGDRKIEFVKIYIFTKETAEYLSLNEMWAYPDSY